MDRTKLFAASLAFVVAGGFAVLFAGSASAATWHNYEGDLYAGHAYGLSVPEGAEGFEITFDGLANGTARVGIYDPAGAKVGYYPLSASLTSAEVANPVEGRYVVYVYELTEGALHLRVNAPAAPAMLALQKMPLVKEDTKVGASDAAGKLDKVMTANLKAVPVFVTLLYEGSAQSLDATVASGKGDVVTIQDESGTAFSPGVWTALSGTRTMEPANLDGLTYTVTAHAERFEGTLVLTTLAVDFKAKAPADAAPAPANVTASVPAQWAAAGASALAFGEGKAYAFEAKAGDLLLADPVGLEQQAKQQKAGENETVECDDDCYGIHSAISIYTPDDRLLEYVELDHDESMATVALPADGEYVAYVHTAANEVVLAKLAGADNAPSLHELPLANETFAFDATSMGFFERPAAFKLAHVPVSMELGSSDDAFAVLAWANVYNEKGTVASYDQILPETPMPFYVGGGSWQNPENFRAGDHELQTQGFYEGKLTLVSTYYLRSGAPTPAPVAPAPPTEAAQDAAAPVAGLLGLNL